jgi:hypothetical protein
MKKLRWLVSIVLTVGLAMPAPPAAAWNDTGHAAVGLIAHRQLGGNAALTTRSKVIALLRRHPFYENVWRQQQPDGTDEGEYLFMRAAMWPDDIRDQPAFHHDRWHYINLPYSPPGSAVRGPQPVGESILTALRLNEQEVQDPAVPDARKAIALCWLFHLLGDLHQPMHTVSLFTPEYPRGDRGGNDFWISTARGPLRLHALWDGLIGGRLPIAAARRAVVSITSAHPVSTFQPAPAEGGYDAWAKQGFALAGESVYLGGRLRGSRESRPSPPALPPGYEVEAARIAQRQLALAGYRLASVLRTVLP